MNVTLGIDLGSTTCKAIVLDENKRIVGKGITNTRSNYTTAIDIARHEALTNARFSQLSSLGAINQDELSEYETLYHVADYVNKHCALQDRLQQLAGDSGKPDWTEPIASLGQQVSELLEQPKTRQAIGSRTMFFKDLMYTAYLEAADEQLPAGSLESEGFMGMLDKALVTVENEMMQLKPDEALKKFIPKERHEVLDLLMGEEIKIVNQVGTGYGRQLLPFEKEQIQSEIMCHAKGAHYLFPNTSTVLDIGGQDTKAIQLDSDGIVRSFFMNDRCAAGCGRYLGYVSEELAIGLSELGPSACSACKFIPITSTCTVFAGAELRDLLYAGEETNEILLGLHRAIVLRAMSLLARSGGIFNQFTFTGGVAKNQAVVQVLRELVEKNYQNIEINIHPDSIYMGALGASLYAREVLC